MSKSEVRKIMLREAQAVCAGTCDVDFFDTLAENRNRSHVGFTSAADRVREKVPVSLSLVDGSVMVVQYMNANSLPDEKGISLDEFRKDQTMRNERCSFPATAEPPPTSDQLWDDNHWAELGGHDGPEGVIHGGKHNFGRKSKYVRASAIEGNPSGTWRALGNCFVSRACHEFLRLSPPSISCGESNAIQGSPEKPAGDRPCMAPVVVFGFDKYSENIKAETQAKRAADRERSLQNQKVKDEKNGFITRRGLPLDPARIMWPKFDSANEKLPYPPQEVVGSTETKNIIDAFVSSHLIRSAIEGRFPLCFLKKAAGKRRHRIMQMLLDGHRLYPRDNEDLDKAFSSGNLGCSTTFLRAMTLLRKRNKVELPYGSDSPLYFTPISIFILFDDEDYLLKHLDELYDCPMCEVARYEKKGACLTTDDEQVILFCNKDCPRYRLAERRRVVDTSKMKHWASMEDSSFETQPDLSSDDVSSSQGGGSYGVKSYCYTFVGDRMPDKLFWFMKRMYRDCPHELMYYRPNEIGEFDFTTFQVLYETIYKRMKQSLTNTFLSPVTSNGGKGPRLTLGVRIVTIDTDAFVLSLMATEILQPILGVDLHIFLVNNHSGSSRKALDKKASKEEKPTARTTNILLGLSSPDHQVFSIKAVANAFRKLFSSAEYPASNVAIALYSKENDYLLMSLRGASIETFYSVYLQYFDHFGRNLIVNKWTHPAAWKLNNGDALHNALLMIDEATFKRYYDHIYCYAIKAFIPDLPYNKQRTANQPSVDARKKAANEKRRKSGTIQMPESTATNIRYKQMLYILQLYCNSVTGSHANRTIPATQAHLFHL